MKYVSIVVEKSITDFYSGNVFWHTSGTPEHSFGKSFIAVNAPALLEALKNDMSRRWDRWLKAARAINGAGKNVPVTQINPAQADIGEAAVKELTKNIVDFTAKYAPDYGPGSEKERQILAPESATVENIYKTVELLSSNKIEILIPSSIGLTGTVQNALAKIRQKKGEKSVVCRFFDSPKHLGDMLKGKPEDGIKRIVVSTNFGARSIVEALLAESPELFSGVRMLGFELPKNYDELSTQDRGVYQADMITRAILVRLLERNGNPFVRSLLKSMIAGRLLQDVDVEAFIDNLVESENEANDPQIIATRVRYCLNTLVSLVEKIGEQLIILRHFVWTAA